MTGAVGRWVGWCLGGLARAVVVAAMGFGVLVGPAVGVLVAVGERYEGDWVFGRWEGVVFKSVYGGVLAVVLGPVLAFMWMVRAGWIVRRHA